MLAKKAKTALVLAGGGLTGAVYEIGALRAIDDLLMDRTVNDFDIFIGTSAGSLVASFIANGLSPEEMLQVIDNTHRIGRTVERKHLFNLDLSFYLRWMMKLPSKIWETSTGYLRHFSDTTFFDLLWSLGVTMPAGIYDAAGLEAFVRDSLKELDYTNDFNKLERELYIVATDLDSGERTVFGKGFRNTPISMAVAASSALPMLYRPVRIDGKEYVDGGIRGNASIDLAIEQGATMIVCINPMVPFDNEPHDPEIEFTGASGYLSERGIQSVANQVFRILLHSGLHYHIKQLRRAHPEVDIILIEPKQEDRQMFLYNIMNYSARLMVARHGFESVTLDLAREYYSYKEILQRHGIPISRSVVIEELAQISGSGDNPEILRRVLEARSPKVSTPRRGKVLSRLDQTLSMLETKLVEFQPAQLEVEAEPQA